MNKTEEKNIVVYAIRNNKNGKLYIGSSSEKDKRIARHIYQLENHCHPVESMQKDFDDSKGDFSEATLFNGDFSDAVLLIEKLFMTLLKTRDGENGYNYKEKSEDFDIAKVDFRSMREKKRRKRSSDNPVREWLITARESAGMKQEDVANKLGISPSYYSFIENGVRQKKMDIALAAKLSAILGIPIAEIIEMENSE